MLSCQNFLSKMYKDHNGIFVITKKMSLLEKLPRYCFTDQNNYSVHLIVTKCIPATCKLERYKTNWITVKGCFISKDMTAVPSPKLRSTACNYVQDEGFWQSPTSWGEPWDWPHKPGLRIFFVIVLKSHIIENFFASSLTTEEKLVMLDPYI